MGSTESAKKLFQPLRVGNVTLLHRVVMAPLTRFRVDISQTPTALMIDYYAQRASVPGTLIIAEATFIAAKAAGHGQCPGIWSDEQITGWKKIVDAVHARGSYIYLQLVATGRAAYPDLLSGPSSPSNPGGPYPYVAPSAIPLSTRPASDPIPRALVDAEIEEHIKLFHTAAKNSIYGAGFDGVEIDAAHGYIIDQFLQDTSNKREDKWGGSIEGRTRFALEVTKAVVDAVGEERTGVRLSPWASHQDMRMADPMPTFSYFVSQLRSLYPRFAYIHAVEPRISGPLERIPEADESNDLLRSIWSTAESEANGSVYIAAGGYTRDEALRVAEEKGGLVAFGRYFVSNPDLPNRILKNISFTSYDRSTFYTKDQKGYNDYPFADVDAEANYRLTGSD